MSRSSKVTERNELIFCNYKKYKHHSSKDVVEVLENVLNKDFTAITINEKWVEDINYVHTIKDSWTYVAFVMDLHIKKL